MKKRFGQGVLTMMAVAVLVLCGQPSWASPDDKRGFAGGLFGISIPDYEDTSARGMFGFTGGAKIGTEFGVAGYYLSSGKEESAEGATFDFDYNLYGVQFSYHFEGEAIGAWFGARLGLSKVTSRVSGVAIEGSPLHIGVAGGYDHFIADNVSLGGEISYLNVADFNETVSGVTVKSKAFNTLNFLGAAKFWF